MAGGLALAAIGAVPARAEVLITVDKSAQLVTVQVDGATRWQWKVSTGRIGHDTPNGTYHALYLDADHHSKKYDDAPMPHSIFFTELGHALHGTFAVRQLGMPASHGCVRLEPQNATALFALVKQEGLRGTTIVITGNAKDALAKARPPAAPAARTAAQPPRERANDERAAAAKLYPQPSAPRASEQATALNTAPLAPPPNFPPFPRPATF